MVEAIGRLDVLPRNRVEALHDEFGQTTVSEEEAHRIGAAIREHLLPSLRDDERLLLDGRRTPKPDDATFHTRPEDRHKNYSTNRHALEEFADFCECCRGFVIW